MHLGVVDRMKNEMKLTKEEAEFLFKGMENLRLFMLKQKEHIKKYYKCRRLHSEVLNSMSEYIMNDKYDLNKELNEITESLVKEVKHNFKILNIDFDFHNDLDFSIFLDISIYKNHPNMKCVLDEYLLKNKFRNVEKVYMLHAMQNSFTSFFKVKKQEDDGFVELEDLVTNKIYKVTDISLSNPMYKNNNTYFYSRMITMNDINFLSGIMAFSTNIKKVNNYIKDCKYKKKSKLVEILEVFNLNKEYGVKTKTNTIK